VARPRKPLSEARPETTPSSSSRPISRTMLNLVSTTPEKGARTALYLATSPEVENVSRQFIGPKRKPLKLAAQANEPEARRRLRDLSVKMTALRQAPLTTAASPRLSI
jgi:hypothetical protein